MVTAPDDIEVPAQLPLLEGLSWFDHNPRALSLFDMLQRYEGGFKDWGVVAQPSEEERAFIKKLVALREHPRCLSGQPTSAWRRCSTRAT